MKLAIPGLTWENETSRRGAGNTATALTYHSDLSGRQAGVSVPSEEQWRPIPGFERTYEVSDRGRVWSRPRPRTRGGLLKLRVSKRGYPMVTLVQDGRQTTNEVHRLVALAFLGPRPDQQEVRHLDGNPLNPALSNLRYGTSSENNFDKVRHGTDHNSAKTHCPQGHPYTPENTYYRQAVTNRKCKTCTRDRDRKRKVAA